MKALILAAGYGTRFQPVTFTLPKPLVPVCNRPLIGWPLQSLLAQGIDRFIVNLHHHPDALRDEDGAGLFHRSQQPPSVLVDRRHRREIDLQRTAIAARGALG